MAFIDCHFYSEALGVQTAVYVILPQPLSAGQIGVSERRRRAAKHPVLFLFHGMSDDHTIWLRRTSVERYAAERGLAVVMPAVGRSYYQDMAHGPRYWTFVSDELPRLVRSFFPLSNRREANFVAGLSMGGYGAMRLALTYPERYAAAASLSGAVDVAERCRLAAGAADAGGRREMRDMFGEDLAVAGTDRDLFHLARRLATSRVPRPRVYQYCGKKDFLYRDSLRFRNLLRRQRFSLTYAEDGGDHSWPHWDRQIQKVIGWLPF